MQPSSCLRDPLNTWSSHSNTLTLCGWPLFMPWRVGESYSLFWIESYGPQSVVVLHTLSWNARTVHTVTMEVGFVIAMTNLSATTAVILALTILDKLIVMMVTRGGENDIYRHSFWFLLAVTLCQTQCTASSDCSCPAGETASCSHHGVCHCHNNQACPNHCHGHDCSNHHGHGHHGQAHCVNGVCTCH